MAISGTIVFELTAFVRRSKGRLLRRACRFMYFLMFVDPMHRLFFPETSMSCADSRRKCGSSLLLSERKVDADDRSFHQEVSCRESSAWVAEREEREPERADEGRGRMSTENEGKQLVGCLGKNQRAEG